MKNWYVIHSKPRQEQRALYHLRRQGYECFLPVIAVEKIRQGVLTVTEEPLFPRYMFIRLGEYSPSTGWRPIRSTVGVSNMVCFGSEPAKVDEELIAVLRSRGDVCAASPEPLFSAGERVRITDGPYSGVEAIYQMRDGAERAMVLIELLSRPAKLSVAVAKLSKAE